MPLLDHFHPPLSRTHPWRAFHGAWAAAMARLLNASVLPPGYYAVPFLDRDGPVEIDVAALRETETPGLAGGPGATQPWAPPAPGFAIAVEWPDADEVRVEVFTDDGDPQLAATIELVSPAIKDRPNAREAFVSKCADHLRRGCGLVVVDFVTTRRADIHAELLTAIGAESSDAQSAGLHATAYRAVDLSGQGQLQVWQTALEIGNPLPIVPLWLGGGVAVPLDLEASHSAACQDLRIRQAS